MSKCICRFCKAGQAHPATPDHGTYEPALTGQHRADHANPSDLICTSCGHVLPREEVTPA